MLPSEKLAIAAHLHVLLRRKTGRVTDTEWMAQNAEYAAEIVRFARQKATEDGHPDLAEWAGKLELAVQAAAPAPRPLAQAAVQALRAARVAGPPSVLPQESIPAADSRFPESQLEPPRPADPQDPVPTRYVGGIR